MRILHVITSLHVGGAEKLMVDLLPRLKASGVDVELLLFNGTRTMFFEQLEKENVKIHVFSEGGNVYNPKNLFRLYGFLKKNKFDIIHSHNTAPQLFAAVVSMFLPINLVTTEHNTTNRRRNWKLYKMVDKWMYSRYKTIVCISDKAEENLTSYLDKKNIQKCVTAYNGVDINKFLNATSDSSLKSDKIIVTMVAGFRHQKDQDTLIKAFALLPQGKFELWLVGDGVRRTELDELVKSEGISDSTKFWGIRNDIPSILKSSDIVVMSSHYEGLSLSSIEGMAVGKPFIASAVDGLREITEGAGVLFEEGNYEQLADLILDLSNNTELYKKVSDKCLQRAHQYDISKMLEGYLAIYLELYN